MRNRFVTVVVPDRYHAPWLPIGAHFFMPVELRDGQLFSLIADEEKPKAWGFETFEDAYRVIQNLEAQDECEGYSGRSFYGHRGEDFHADDGL